MDLKRKIARLVMSSVSNRDCDAAPEQYRRLKRDVAEVGVAGYVVFGGNVESTYEMIEDLSSLCERRLLVASDLERGLGQQLEGGTLFPSAMALGAAGQTELAQLQGFLTALEARAVGINLVLAPVADVNTEPANPIIGVRSYGEDPHHVASFASAFVKGCQLGGAAAVGKHFPGHGDTSVDSHVRLPRVEVDRELLSARELVPFAALIEQSVQALMTAHVSYPRVTGDGAPATFSRAIVQGILREDLRFTGVVISDALSMGAISGLMNTGEAGVAALRAGVDLLLMPPGVEETIEAVAAAVVDGRLSEERIDQSIERVDSLLQWLGDRPGLDSIAELTPPSGITALDHLALPRSDGIALLSRHYQVASHAAAMCGTLLRDEDHLLPLREADLARKRTALLLLKEEASVDCTVWLRAELEARLPNVTVVEASSQATQAELSDAAAVAGSVDCCIVCVLEEVAAWREDFGLCPSHIGLVRRIIENCGRTIVVAFANPQIAAQIPGVRTLACFYDGSQACQEAAARAILGECPLPGRLPVGVPGMFDLGHGLGSS